MFFGGVGNLVSNRVAGAFTGSTDVVTKIYGKTFITGLSNMMTNAGAAATVKPFEAAKTNIGVGNSSIKSDSNH